MPGSCECMRSQRGCRFIMPGIKTYTGMNFSFSIGTRAVLNSKASFSITKGYVQAIDEKYELTMSADGESSTMTVSTQALLLPEVKPK